MATFGKSKRILRTAEFRNVYDHGVRFSGPLFSAFYLARTAAGPDSESRLGLTVPRAVGKAVVRNRIKRRMREVFRLHCSELDRGWDIVVNPRRALLKATFGEIERAFGKVIQRCNSC